MALKKFLDTHYTIIFNKKVNQDSTCKTYYPDFVIDLQTFFLVIECDEYAHSSYPKDCEKIRENNIVFSLGLPCVFLRFNPDKKKIPIKTKYKILKSYIDYYSTKKFSDSVVEYLFY
jgi:hypothetical protein